MRVSFLLLFSSIFLTADIKVITSSRSPIGAISKEQLIKIYLKEIDRINGVEVVPIDNSDTKVYNEFYEKLINRAPNRYTLTG